MSTRCSLAAVPMLAVMIAALTLISLSCDDDETPMNPNLPPVAIFTVAPDSGDIATGFVVDATASFDGQDQAPALRFRWDWETDGAWDTDFTAARMDTVLFATPGTKTISLEVLDSGGLRDTASTDVMVTVTLPPPPPSRATVEELLEAYLVQAYDTKDSVLYQAALASAFTFTFLPEDAESLGERGILFPGEDSWGRTLDLKSTGTMFRSNNVGEISLDIFAAQNSPYMGGDCVNCRLIDADITLNVTTDPQAPEPRILTVESPQQFVVAKDPADTTQWVIAKQIDQPSSGTTRLGGSGVATRATTPSTWGQVKGFFSF